MIEIENEHPKLRANRVALKKLLRDTILREQKQAGSITLLMVTDRKLAKLHKEFLQDPSRTDVMTFDLSITKAEIAGDIVVSLDRAFEQAQEFGVTLLQETGRLAVHGILHLCGMSDRTPALRKKMNARETWHLQQSGWIMENQ
ncbi:MAG: rRNA maturation RNase YbeY [bacterium]|nr:rRNA maturation RNase YbeY [bacterium]